MRTLLVAVLFLVPSVATAADPPIVFQTQSVGRLLDEARAVIDFVAGEKEVKAFNDELRQALGEKGFEGLDLTRPVAGYIAVTPKLEQSAAVVALPVTGEKEFLDLCERANKQRPKGTGGLYELPGGPTGKAMMRIADGYAYLCAADDPAAHLDPKALVPAAKLIDPNERALACGKIHFDRVPKEMKDQAKAMLAQMQKGLAEPPPGFGGQEWNILKGPAEQLAKLGDRYLTLSADAKELALRLNMDPLTADMTAELSLTAKPGTALDKVFAGRKPTTNRFTGLLGPDTVAGLKFSLPLFNDELRASAVAGLEGAKVEATRTSTPTGKAAAEAFFDGLIRVAKTGEADLALAVRGPGKDGNYYAVGAMSFEDGAPFEKAFRKFAEDDPPPGPEKIQWEVAKAGTVNIHSYKMSDGGFLNPATLFGKDKCVMAFAFGPKGLYMVMGTDAVTVMKEVLAAQPAPSPVFDVVVNPSRVAKFAGTVGDAAAALKVEDALGKDDKLKSAASLTVAGGKELKITFTVNAKVLPRAIFMSGTRAESTFEKVEPGIKK